jgi:hypothetical protein
MSAGHLWPHRLTVRTPGFHPGNRGSIPREVTTKMPDFGRVFSWPWDLKSDCRNRVPKVGRLPVISLQRMNQTGFEDQSHAQVLAPSTPQERLPKAYSP